MSEEESKREFDEIVEFTPPEQLSEATQCARFIDRESGIVFYGFQFAALNEGGIAVTSHPIEQTELTLEDDE